MGPGFLRRLPNIPPPVVLFPLFLRGFLCVIVGFFGLFGTVLTSLLQFDLASGGLVAGSLANGRAGDDFDLCAGFSALVTRIVLFSGVSFHDLLLFWGSLGILGKKHLLKVG